MPFNVVYEATMSLQIETSIFDWKTKYFHCAHVTKSTLADMRFLKAFSLKVLCLLGQLGYISWRKETIYSEDWAKMFQPAIYSKCFSSNHDNGPTKQNITQWSHIQKTEKLKPGKECYFNLKYHSKYKKVKLSLCLTKHHVMKMYWGSGGTAPCILDLGMRGKWASASCPGHFTPRERAPCTHWIGGWGAPEPLWTWWWRDYSNINK
jgi:hypothetical protein